MQKFCKFKPLNIWGKKKKKKKIKVLKFILQKVIKILNQAADAMATSKSRNKETINVSQPQYMLAASCLVVKIMTFQRGSAENVQNTQEKKSM